MFDCTLQLVVSYSFLRRKLLAALHGSLVRRGFGADVLRGAKGTGLEGYPPAQTSPLSQGCHAVHCLVPVPIGCFWQTSSLQKWSFPACARAFLQMK